MTTLLLSQKGVVYAGSGNIGKIFELRNEYEREGSLESEVFDTRLFAKWGRVSWKNQTPEGTSVTLATRSGNVDDPSRNWSSWSHPYRIKAGEPADSPGARFLQWKVTLASNDGKRTPIVDEVEIAYLPKNVAPIVEEVEATPGGYRNNSSSAPPNNQPQTITLQPLGQRQNNNPPPPVMFSAPLSLTAHEFAAPPTVTTSTMTTTTSCRSMCTSVASMKRAGNCSRRKSSTGITSGTLTLSLTDNTWRA